MSGIERCHCQLIYVIGQIQISTHCLLINSEFALHLQILDYQHRLWSKERLQSVCVSRERERERERERAKTLKFNLLCPQSFIEILCWLKPLQ